MATFWTTATPMNVANLNLAIDNSGAFRNGQAGVLTPTSVGWLGAGNGVAANVAYGSRFVTSKAMSVVSIAFGVSTAATADDACDVAIYDSTLTRLASAGATTGRLNTTGVKTVSLSVSLSAATVYYAAFSSGTQGGTAATVRGANFADTTVTQLFGATAPNMEAWLKTASHPLPSTIVSPSSHTFPVVLAVRES
jgi:hypothetical protein